MLNEHNSDCPHDFVKLMFIKWSAGCFPVGHSSVQTTGEAAVEKFITHRSWRKDTVKGFMRTSRQSMERRHDLGLIPLLE